MAYGRNLPILLPPLYLVNAAFGRATQTTTLMKRYTPEAIEALRKRSEQSRNGEAVESKDGSKSVPLSNGLKLTIGRVGRPQPKNGAAIDMGDQVGPTFQVRITKNPQRRR